MSWRISSEQVGDQNGQYCLKAKLLEEKNKFCAVSVLEKKRKRRIPDGIVYAAFLKSPEGLPCTTMAQFV